MALTLGCGILHSLGIISDLYEIAQVSGLWLYACSNSNVSVTPP